MPLSKISMRSRHANVVPTVLTGDAPLGNAAAALAVRRNEPARLLGEVESDRGRLGDDEAIVVDDRHLPKWTDPAVRFTVELAAGVVERVHSVGQAGLLERPLRPEVLGLADAGWKDASEAVERDHFVRRFG